MAAGNLVLFGTSLLLTLLLASLSSVCEAGGDDNYNPYSGYRNWYKYWHKNEYFQGYNPGSAKRDVVKKPHPTPPPHYKPSPKSPKPPVYTPTPSPVYKPPPSPSPNPYTPDSSNLAAQFMMPQNAARSSLGLKPLVWDSKLEAFAQDWANKRARYGNCYLQHSDGPYGENIFWGSGKAWSGKDAADAWVEERKWYDYGSNSCSAGQQCGHYTQIVWRDTQRIGCARVVCSSGDVFMTCNYDPPGNYIGEKPY